MKNKKQFLNCSEKEKEKVANLVFSATMCMFYEMMWHSEERGEVIREIRIHINEKAFEINDGTVCIKRNALPIRINTKKANFKERIAH